MKLAFHWASFSKDIKTKVGALVVCDNKKIVIGGYNGFPEDEPDDERLYTEEKNNLMVHAEKNAILNAWDILGNDYRDELLFTTKYPCIDCARFITDCSEDFTIYTSPMDKKPKWLESQKQAEQHFKEKNINVIIVRGTNDM